MNNPPYDLVYVEWDDAVGNSKWFDREELEEWFKVSSWFVHETGWLLKEDKYAIYLAAFWKPEDGGTVEQFGSIRRIPKNWIRKRVKLTKHIKSSAKI